MSGYLLKPIRDNEDFKGAVRNMANMANLVNWEKKAVFIRFFKVMGEM